MKVFILGIRHSGTTPFWQVFRQDPRFRCYNEPFNPEIRHIGAPDWPNTGVYGEYLEMMRREPARFWETYRAIHGLEELQEGLSDAQERYLRYLLAESEHVAADTTRCHFKLAALKRICPSAVLVHLWRNPASVATSHMIFSGTRLSWIKDPLRRRYRMARSSVRRTLDRQTFWYRKGGYRMFEPIIGSAPQSLFGLRLAQAGLDPEAIYDAPAVTRVLAYWKVNQHRITSDGPRQFGQRFLNISFDDFCRDPAQQVARVYRALGEQMPDLDLSAIHPPHGPYQQESSRWAEHLRAAGLAEFIQA